MTSMHSYQPAMSGSLFPSAQAAKLPVRVTGLITADDVIASLKAVGKWRYWRIPLLVLPVLLMITFVTLTNRRRGVAWPVPIVSIAAGLFLLTAPLRARHRFIKSWNARTEFQHPVSWTFSNEGLFTETVSSKSLRDWSGFIYAKITPDRIVLAHPGETMFSFIPRRLFSTEDDWTATCQLLAAKLPVRGP